MPIARDIKFINCSWRRQWKGLIAVIWLLRKRHQRPAKEMHLSGILGLRVDELKESFSWRHPFTHLGALDPSFFPSYVCLFSKIHNFISQHTYRFSHSDFKKAL